MAHEKHPEVSKSEKLLDNYHEGRAMWATQAMEDDEFRNNQQWKSEHKRVQLINQSFNLLAETILTIRLVGYFQI